MSSNKKWRIHNPEGERRVVVTKELPGTRWLEVLEGAGCRVEICTSEDVLGIADIKAAIGHRCDGAIGQLTEAWGDELFSALKDAGARVYSNYAVGFNNVDIAAATRHGIPVGNTPGVLTETTAEMAVALTFAAARRLGEAQRFLRRGHFKGWLPRLFVGERLHGKTVGLIGAGRVGAAYGRMRVEGHKMHLVYFDLYPNKALEAYVAAYSDFLAARGEAPLTCHRMDTVEALLETADCVSIHTVLDDTTLHLINAGRLNLMKKNALLINTARGPVIKEDDLVAHCRKHPDFRVGPTLHRPRCGPVRAWPPWLPPTWPASSTAIRHGTSRISARFWKTIRPRRPRASSMRNSWVIEKSPQGTLRPPPLRKCKAPV